MENTYLSKSNNSSIKVYQECLDKFSKNFKKEVSLETDTPIFLDANVILRYYSISFTAREKLFEFIKKNIKRIILSSQVQTEFIKNREDVIKRFFEQVTNKIPKDFNSDVVNKMNSFLEQHKIVLKDYPYVESGIQKHKEDLEELLKKLNENADAKRKEYIDLIIKDNFLKLLKSCKVFDPFSSEEIIFLKKEFDILSQKNANSTIDSILNKPGAIFPGFGDIKTKPDDPYGDYIIFHEMMKYMLANETDLLFLTFDNSKGDWMTKEKSPHLHYTQNVYANTNQILYIIDAERTLEDLLQVDIDSLVEVDEFNNLNSITKESLDKLVNNYSLFQNLPKGEFKDHIVKELHVNGYSSIIEIINDLNYYNNEIKDFLKTRSHLNRIGALRGSLRLANENYKFRVNSSGSVMPIDVSSLNRYNNLRKKLYPPR